MAKRPGVLEFAVLGILHESPMHGYELRKRCNAVLGSFRAFSYGSLYPCLKSLLQGGWIAEEGGGAAPPLAGKRSRIVYRLTADGKERFQELVAERVAVAVVDLLEVVEVCNHKADLAAESGPSAWEDDGFGVHFAFFARTDAATRLRILEGRRSRLEERIDGFRSALTRTRERVDSYTLELQRHGLESVEREVRWLNELIESERQDPGARRTASTIDQPTDRTTS